MRDGNDNRVQTFVPEVDDLFPFQSYAPGYWATTYKQARSQAQAEQARVARITGNTYVLAYRASEFAKIVED